MFVRVARQRTSFVAEQRRLTLCSHCSIVLERRRVSFVSGGSFPSRLIACRHG